MRRYRRFSDFSHTPSSLSTPPQVTYELVGYGKAPDFFAIDSESGAITVKVDLQAEQESDFEVSEWTMTSDGSEAAREGERARRKVAGRKCVY